MDHRVTTSFWVDRPRAPVFDLSTTARYWKRWHPATVAVRGDTEGPLQLGDRLIEDVRVGPRSGVVEWRCVERDAPRRLVLEATTPIAASRIVYTFDERDGGTVVGRIIDYSFRRLLERALHPLILGPAMRRQSKIAAERLEVLLRSEIPRG